MSGDRRGPAAPQGFLKLTELTLFKSPVSAQELAELRALKLRTFSTMECTRIGDEALAVLASFPVLEKLSLVDPSISDAGLTHLAKCKTLKSVALKRVPLTEPRSKSWLPPGPIYVSNGTAA